MRVAVVHSRFRSPLGGTEGYSLRLARSLRDRGHDVAIATGSTGREVVEELDGVELFLLPVTNVYTPGTARRSLPLRSIWHTIDVFNPSVLPWIRRTLAAFHPDVVHTQNFQGLSGALFAGIRPFPHVHTVHDSTLLHPRTVLREDTHRPPPLRTRTRLLERLLNGSTMIFPSRGLLDVHRRLGWRTSSSSVVLPHGWELDWQPQTRRRGGKRPLRFLFLGRLSAQKGIPRLLQAWGEGGIEGAELRIAGDGPHRGLVQAAAGRSPSLSYLGWAFEEDKARLFEEIDVVVFPSTTPEGFGLTCAEAILCGRPVVASKTACPEFVRDGENGLLVQGGPDALRAAMTRLVGDRALVSTLAGGARNTAAELDWDRHVDRLQDLYAEVRTA